MAERTGLEPATPGVTGRYSNQLNYRSSVDAKPFFRLTVRISPESQNGGRDYRHREKSGGW